MKLGAPQIRSRRPQGNTQRSLDPVHLAGSAIFLVETMSSSYQV